MTSSSLPTDSSPPRERPARLYEATDFSLRVILSFAVVMVLVMALAMVGLWALWGRYQRVAQETDPQLSPLADVDQTPPAPRLQNTPIADYETFRKQQEEELSTYAWVDRERQTVRIPVARAMEKALKDGLPKPPPMKSAESAEEEGASPMPADTPTEEDR